MDQNRDKRTKYPSIRNVEFIGTETNRNKQNFVLKVYIVITSKVFADFRFESPISKFHSESPGRLSGQKYLQTLVESLCRLLR